MHRTFFALFFLVLAGAYGCVSSSPAVTPPDQSTVPPSEQEYRIGVDDQVAVNVWGNPNLSVNMPVRPDGKISMPLIGDVQAGGLTPEEVAAAITVSLSKYIREPNVTVLLTQLRSHEYISRIRVTGAVNSQVSLPYRQGMTVLDAILAAGGVNEFSAPNKTRLHRKVGGDAKVYDIQLGRILNEGDVESNILLMPGDIITVAERLF